MLGGNSTLFGIIFGRSKSRTVERNEEAGANWRAFLRNRSTATLAMNMMKPSIADIGEFGWWIEGKLGAFPAEGEIRSALIGSSSVCSLSMVSPSF